MEEPKLVFAFEKVSVFSTKRIRTLFIHLEAVFCLMKNNSSQKQFPCVVSALPKETVSFLNALLLKITTNQPVRQIKRGTNTPKFTV